MWTENLAPSPQTAPAQAPTKPASEAALRAATETTDRKIIRSAEITIEIDSPEEGKRKVEAIAEAHGGFVVTSEETDHGDRESGAQKVITVVVRIPAPRFSAVVEEMRKVGNRVRRCDEALDPSGMVERGPLTVFLLSLSGHADLAADVLIVYRT